MQELAFQGIFNAYWRARTIGRHAGNRVCALPNSNYDDPESPYRPIAERLAAAGVALEKRYARALNDVPRPYEIGPPQSLCDDPKAAYEAIFAFDSVVAGLKALLVVAPVPR